MCGHTRILFTSSSFACKLADECISARPACTAVHRRTIEELDCIGTRARCTRLQVQGSKRGPVPSLQASPLRHGGARPPLQRSATATRKNSTPPRRAKPPAVAPRQREIPPRWPRSPGASRSTICGRASRSKARRRRSRRASTSSAWTFTETAGATRTVILLRSS